MVPGAPDQAPRCGRYWRRRPVYDSGSLLSRRHQPGAMLTAMPNIPIRSGVGQTIV